MIAEALVLLERRIVLLIDDDEPEVCNRSKESRPGADGDSDATTPKSLPRVFALPRRQATVEHCDVIAETRSKSADELGSQSDLGYEQDRARPRFADLVDSPEVNLGLSRPGHAMQ
jgi:hypothetical protein